MRLDESNETHCINVFLYYINWIEGDMDGLQQPKAVEMKDGMELGGREDTKSMELYCSFRISIKKWLYLLLI